MKQIKIIITLTICIIFFIKISSVNSYAYYDWSRDWNTNHWSVDEGNSDENIISVLKSWGYTDESIKERFWVEDGSNPDSGNNDFNEPIPELDTEKVEWLINKCESLDLNIESINTKLNEINSEIDLEKVACANVNENLQTLISLLAYEYNLYDSVLFTTDSNYFTDSVNKGVEIERVLNDTNENLNKLRKVVYRDEEFKYSEKEKPLNEVLTDVSDNITDSLATTNEKTLEELNETLLITNKFLSMVMVLLLVTMVLLIAFWIGRLIHNIINRNVY